jgi:surface protein
MAVMAASAATTWKVTEDTPVTANTTLLDDDALTLKTVFATTLTSYSYTYGGEEFTKSIQVRVDQTPDRIVSGKRVVVTGTEYKGGSTPSTSLILTAKQDVTVMLYYRRQKGTDLYDNDNGKNLRVWEQRAKEEVQEGEDSVILISSTQYVYGEDGDFGYVAKQINVEAGKTYTIAQRGTTIQFLGLSYAVPGAAIEIDFSKQWTEDQNWWSWNSSWYPNPLWQDIQVYIAREEGNNYPSFNAENQYVQLTDKNILRVTAPNGKVIAKIDFTFVEGYEATAECFELGAFSDGSWLGESHEVILTNLKGSNIRVQKMVIELADNPFYLFTGWLGGMQYNPIYWNEKNQAYEINVNVGENYQFAVSDVRVMPGKDDDQAVFDYEHRFAIGAGNKEITVGEAADLGNFGAANIVIKDKGNYTISVTKDKKITVTERKLAYASWEFEKDENGNAKFDDYGHLVKDSIVFRYDNQYVGYNWSNQTIQWEFDENPYIAWYGINNTNSHDTKKVVFDKSFAEVEPISVAGLFSDMSSLETVEGFENLNMTNITDLSNLFNSCSALKEVDISKLNTENIKYMDYMFRGCSSLEKIDLSALNTDNVERISYLFIDCNSLKEAKIAGFGKAYQMDGIFALCSSLEKVDVSGLDTKSATNMNYMFNNCSSLKELDLTNFDTQNVNDFSYMFAGCSALEKLDVTSFDVSKAYNLGYMFQNCAALKTLDVSGFNTQNVQYMQRMFQGCAALEALDLSGFTTRQNVGSMAYFFAGCAALKELDLMGFNYGGSHMFENCTALEKIIVNSYFPDNSKSDSYWMFKGATSLKDYDANVVSGLDAIEKYCTIVNRYDLGTLGAGKYMTYYVNDSVKLFQAADGVTLATVTGVSADEVQATVLSAAAKETPLLIYNSTEENQNIVLVTPYLKDDKVDDVKPYAGFQGTLNGQQMAGSSDDLDYYICNGEEFVWVMNSGYVNPNRCWLEIDKKLADAQGAQRRAIVFGDSETTGISIATAEAEQNGNYYDLNGRQLQGKPAQKGLYILNGKKVVIK